MTDTKESTRVATVAFAFILLFGFFARAATFQTPLLDHHAWRQSDTAAISRNFFRERFNIFYPQVDWRGAASVGYVETGVELSAFLVAALSKAVGTFEVEAGRLLSCILFLVSAPLVRRFVGRRYGDEWGQVGAFFHAFGFPLLLFVERAFMNEALLICLSLAALVSAQSYLAHGRILALSALFATTTLVGVVKAPYLIVWAPVAGLFVERYGRTAWRRWELWGLISLSAGATAAWLFHAR